MALALLSVARSVPELRGLGDAERRRWYEAIKAGNRARVSSAWLQAIVGGVLVGLLACVPGLLVLLKAASLSVRENIGPGLRADELSEMRRLGALGWMLVLAGCALVLLVARHLYAGVLRRLIRTTIDEGRCPSCRYSLTGLPANAGAVTCPECGMSTPLPAGVVTASS